MGPEEVLDRNLRIYPKLKFLMDDSNRPFSRYLDSVRIWILTKPISYQSALSACKAIDKLRRSHHVR